MWSILISYYTHKTIIEGFKTKAWKAKTLNLLSRTCGWIDLWTRAREEFLKHNTHKKAQTTKEKIDKLDYVKFFYFCASKGTIFRSENRSNRYTWQSISVQNIKRTPTKSTSTTKYIEKWWQTEKEQEGGKERERERDREGGKDQKWPEEEVWMANKHKEMLTSLIREMQIKTPWDNISYPLDW